MKVGFIAPQSISVINGGVRTQALMTARALTNLGAEVKFLSPWDDISENQLDLFHIFTAGYETIGIISRLRELKKKVVLSPVLFSNRSYKTIRRAISVEEKLTSVSAGIRSEFGIKKEVCKKADLILPNTSSEAKLITKAFELEQSKIKIVPNGVELRFKGADPELFLAEKKLQDFVLFTGQASAPRKNVLSLIKAMHNIDADLVIIGSFNDSEYSKVCLKFAHENPRIHLLETMDHNSDLLRSAYAASKVFVLASQFETPGIAAMEAALAGANIVITEAGGTKDYFKEFAHYVSHNSIESIQKGITEALAKPKSVQLMNHISENYSWSKVGELTMENYQELLK
ncbi:MAG: glycosyltransferase [Balneola sp.]|nr:glycosyltransferase [Balneola sp.]MBO6710522.1 glycosyltransferase [Balneola sp.]MBO6799207.1 glycosyltransferase [Balneola sp.]MBO6871046.1 glycosyltransferase [Balneola sp.]